MRKFVAILLMLLFAANISGASILHHVCGKVSQYVSINGHKKNSKCCCKGSGIDKGCCKTKYFKVKLENKKNVSHGFSIDKSFAFEGFTALSYSLPPNTSFVLLPSDEDDFIPQKVRWRRYHLYIFHCVYRI